MLEYLSLRQAADSADSTPLGVVTASVSLLPGRLWVKNIMGTKRSSCKCFLTPDRKKARRRRSRRKVDEKSHLCWLHDRKLRDCWTLLSQPGTASRGARRGRD